MKPIFYKILIIANILLIIIMINNYVSLKYTYKYYVVKLHFNEDIEDDDKDALVENYKEEHDKKVNRTISFSVLLTFILFVLIILKKKDIIKIKNRKIDDNPPNGLRL